MTSCLSRAFVLKQLTSELKSWSGRMIWRRRNNVLPTTNVSTVAKVTHSAAATSSSATVPSASVHVESDGTSSVGFGVTTKVRLGAYANADNSQFHRQLIELADCLSETRNCNQMLTKVSEWEKPFRLIRREVLENNWKTSAKVCIREVTIFCVKRNLSKNAK